MSRLITGNKAVDNATIEELNDFIASWEGKLTIPSQWIIDNLRDAMIVVGEEE
jgi:hypothetical protein